MRDSLTRVSRLDSHSGSARSPIVVVTASTLVFILFLIFDLITFGFAVAVRKEKLLRERSFTVEPVEFLDGVNWTLS